MIEGQAIMYTVKFKRVFTIFFIVSFSFVLCACQMGSVESDVEEQTFQSIHQMLAQIYIPLITEKDIENPIFSLIFLDNDDIPELVILDRYWGIYSIYTIRDNSAKCLVDSMTTVEMTYYECKNIISTFYRSKGGGAEGEFSSSYYQLDQYPEALTNYAVPSFQFAYYAVYNENGEWSGTGITSYYKNDKEIDEAAYHQLFVDLNISESDDVSCFSKSSKCFTKDEILTYLNEETTAEVVSQ